MLSWKVKKRRTKVMILCEQCGNDFRRGNIIKKDSGEYIQCPFCYYHNKRVYSRRKRRKKNYK